jgi:hypothetical protein
VPSQPLVVLRKRAQEIGVIHLFGSMPSGSNLFHCLFMWSVGRLRWR